MIAIIPLVRSWLAALARNRLVRIAFGLRPYLGSRLPTFGNWNTIRSNISGPRASLIRCASTPYLTLAPSAESFALFSFASGEICLGPSKTVVVMRLATIRRDEARLNEKLRFPSPTKSTFPVPATLLKLKDVSLYDCSRSSANSVICVHSKLKMQSLQRGLVQVDKIDFSPHTRQGFWTVGNLIKWDTFSEKLNKQRDEKVSHFRITR